MANTRRVVIDLNEAQLTGDVTNLPATLARTNLPNEMCDPSGAFKAASDGRDIRAFEPDGIGGWDPIPCEVIDFAWDSATNAADAYVAITVLVSAATVASGAQIALEYHDTASQATQPAEDATYGSREVYQDWSLVTTDLTRNEVTGEAFTIDGTLAGTATQDGPNGLKARGFGLPANGGVGVTDNDGVASTLTASPAAMSMFCVSKRTGAGGNGTGFARYRHSSNGWDWYTKNGVDKNYLESEHTTTDGEWQWARPAVNTWAAQSVTVDDATLPVAFLSKVKQTVTQVVAPVGTHISGTAFTNIFGHGALLHDNNRQFAGYAAEYWQILAAKSDDFHAAWHTMMETPTSFGHCDAGSYSGDNFVFHYEIDHATTVEAGFVYRICSTNFTGGASHGVFSAIAKDGGNLRAYTDDSLTTRIPLHVVRVKRLTGDIDIRVRFPTSRATTQKITFVCVPTALDHLEVDNALGAAGIWGPLNGRMVTTGMVKDSITGQTLTVGNTLINITSPTGFKGKEAGSQNATDLNGKLTTPFTADFEDFTIFIYHVIQKNDTAARQFFHKGSTLRGEIDSGERPGIVRTHADGSNTWEASTPGIGNWRTRMWTCDDSVSGSATHYVNGASQALTTNDAWTPPHTSSAGTALVLMNGSAGNNAASHGLAVFWLLESIQNASWARAVANNFLSIGAFWTAGTPASIATNATLNVPALTGAVTLRVPTLTLQANSILNLNKKDAQAAVTVPTLTAQTNTSLALAKLNSSLVLRVPTISAQANSQLTIPHKSSGITLYTPTLNAPVNGTIAINPRNPSLDLYAPTISAQSNGSIAIGNRPSYLSLYTPVLRLPNPTITVPLRTNTPSLFTPNKNIQSNSSLSLAFRTSTAQLRVPTLATVIPPITLPLYSGSVTLHALTPTAQGNSTVTVPLKSSGVTLFPVGLQTVTGDTITMPELTNGIGYNTPVLTRQSNGRIVMGRRASFLALRNPVPSIQANNAIALLALPGNLNIRPVTIREPANPQITVPQLTTTLVVNPVTMSRQANKRVDVGRRASFLSLRVPTIQLQGTPTIVVPHRPSGVTMTSPFMTVGKSLLQVPHKASGVTIFSPSFAPQSTGGITVPYLANAATLRTPGFALGNLPVTMPYLINNVGLFPLNLTTLSGTQFSVPHFMATTSLLTPTLDDGSGLQIMLPALKSSLAISPVKLRNPSAPVPVGPQRPRILGIGPAEWKDWTSEHLPKNFRRYNGNQGSQRQLIHEGRWIPQTGWLYVNPNETIDIRPARASNADGFDVDPGVWSFRWELQPGTGGGLGIENLPNTAVIALGGASAPVESPANFFKMTRNMAGSTDTQLVQVKGNANGGWIRFYWWGPEKFELDVDDWRPETIAYLAEYDYVRWMNAMRAINARCTRASDWFDDSSETWEYPATGLSGDPATLNFRSRMQCGFKFKPLMQLNNLSNTIGWFCMPVGIGAYSSELQFWTSSSPNGGAAAFRDAIQADGANIVADMNAEWVAFGIKFFTSLVNSGYPDSRPVLIELGNENWNNQYWLNVQYLVGLGRYLRSVYTGFTNNSDLGNGHGWAHASMMAGMMAARAALKPNQVIHFVAGAQTASSTFDMQGFADGLNMFLAQNPSQVGKVKLSDVFIGTTGYWSGTAQYRAGGFLTPAATDNITFATEWKTKYEADKIDFFEEQTIWFTQSSAVRDNAERVRQQHTQFQNYAATRGFRGVIQYEGSSHNNMNGASPASQSLSVLYPQANVAWSEYVQSTQGEMAQDYVINLMALRIDPVTPAVRADVTDTGWKPHTLPTMNFKDIGPTRSSSQPWNERLITQISPAGYPKKGMAQSWLKVGRTALPAGLDNDRCNVPFKQGNIKLFAPSTADSRASITPNTLASTLQLFPPNFPSDGTDALDLPRAVNSVQIFNLTLIPQSDSSLVLPTLASGTVIETVDIVDSNNNAIVAPRLLSTVLALSPTLSASGNQQLNLGFKTSSLKIESPLFYVLRPDKIEMPSLRPTSRVYGAGLQDSVSNQEGQIESNPFDGNIPQSLRDSLPKEAVGYFESLAQTLRGVYERIQSGTAVFPAALLRHLDTVAQYKPGSKAQFYHPELGFIHAQYRQFYEDSASGAPAGLSLFDLDQVSSVYGNTQAYSLLGLIAATNPPRKSNYGWIIVEGRSTQPVIAGSDIATGDEVVWTADDSVSTKVAGAILGRYRGKGVALGEEIPAGDIDVLHETNAAGRLLLDLQGINSKISTLAIADADNAKLVEQLVANVNEAIASVAREVVARVTGDQVLAQKIDIITADLGDKITASFTASQQALASMEGSLITLIEESRTEFSDALAPLNLSISEALTKLTQATNQNLASAEAISSLTVGLESNTLGLQATSDALNVLSATVTQQGNTITAQSSQITSINSQINSINGTIANAASVLVQLQTDVQTVEGDVANIQAQWGVTVDVNNRVTGMIKLSATQVESTFDILADRFRVFNGNTDTAVFEVSSGKVMLNGITLNDLVQAEEGNRILPIGVGVAQGVCRDGVPVVYSVAWSKVPSIIFSPGGKMYEPTFGTIQEQTFTALNPTTSGFTPYLKLRDVTGVVTTHTLNNPVPTSGGPLFKVVKTAAAEASSDQYTFLFNISVPQSPHEPSSAIVAAYTRTSSGLPWTQRAAITYGVPATGQIISITVDGLGANSEFGMGVTWIGAIQGTFNSGDFIAVSYVTSTGGTVTTATPAGVASVPFTIIGNRGVI